MEPDATYKHLLSSAFMVEELMRWLVADRHGMHALVDSLDFSTLTRMHEQSVTDDGEALRRRSNGLTLTGSGRRICGATTRRRCWRGWRIRSPRRCRSWPVPCAGGCGRRSCAS